MNRDALLNYLNSPQQGYFSPPQYSKFHSVGTFYSNDIPDSLNAVNVFSYQGNKSLHTTLATDDDDDQEDIEADPGASKNRQRITFSNTDSEEENLTLHEAEMCTWENLPGLQGSWKLRLLCPHELFGALMGAKQSNVHAFKQDFPDVSTKFVDRSEKEDKVSASRKQLSISGSHIELSHRSNRKTLLRAYEFWGAKITENMNKLPYTHFVSLPFLMKENAELCTRFTRFREKLLDHKVNERLIAQPGKLHLTLCMLRLYSKEDMKRAIDIIQRLRQNPQLQELFSSERPALAAKEMELPPKGLSIHLQGLHVFQEDESQCRVLFTSEARGRPVSLADQQEYKPPTPWLGVRRSATTYINQLSEVLFQEFLDAELLDLTEMNRQKLLDPAGKLDVRYHVTLVNTSFFPQANGLDASEILMDLRNFDFGVGLISGLHLSRRGGASIDTDYYVAETVLPIRQSLGI